ncbi:putative calcium-binding protein CML19 [Miscanthus floridulus]|uniref:putative calcium-binding protein CML19 n=1 Tax=Miscanthus floridulus TaxID=154761 RepID=UPI00345A9282
MAVYASSEFSRVFSALDRGGDGKLSAAELRLCMKEALGEDVSAEEADRLVASPDADGDGLLSQEELLGLALAGTAAPEEEVGKRRRVLREAFGMYAIESKGCITPVSLKRMVRLGSHQDVDECRAMICRFDLDGDGVLSFEEFKIMMDS